MTKRRKARGFEPYVQLLKHEIQSPAYRSLKPDARALLVEFRALYQGRDNRIFMSVREAMKRIGVGQRPAQNAIAQLLDRGFIRLIEPGSFTRKVKHATVYALTNQPLTDNDGATAPKDFMRWTPPPQKNTVVEITTDGSRNHYREGSRKPEKHADGSRNHYCEGEIADSTVVEITTQIGYHRGCKG